MVLLGFDARSFNDLLPAQYFFADEFSKLRRGVSDRLEALRQHFLLDLGYAHAADAVETVARDAGRQSVGF